MRKNLLRTAIAAVLAALIASCAAAVLPVPEEEQAGKSLIGMEPTAVPTQSKRVVGYFCEWSIYEGHNNYRVSMVPFNKLTHINYAFAGSGNPIVMLDPWADEQNTFDVVPWGDKYAGCLGQLMYYKTVYPHIKTMISIGGWTRSDAFHAIAASASTRQAFAASAISWIRKWNMDGVDIDWEYPGVNRAPDPSDYTDKGCPGGPEDKQNYTLLLKDLRSALDVAGAQDGKYYELTVAVGAGYEVIDLTDPADYAQYVDAINLMTYDYHGGFDSKIGHQAALYPNPLDPFDEPLKSRFNIDYTVNKFISMGVPASKLVVGMPFYTRGWNNVKVNPAMPGGMFGTGGGTLLGKWGGGGQGPYSEVEAMRNNPSYQEYWDDVSKAPYLYNASAGTLYTYDNEKSVGIKCDYILSKNLGGAMYWEIDGDPNMKLVNIVASKLLSGVSSSSIVSSAMTSSKSSSASLSSSSTGTSQSSAKTSSSSSSSSSVSSFVSSVQSSAIGGSLKVQTYQSGAVSQNQVIERIMLVNTGTSAIALSTVKIRYYIAYQGSASYSFNCDYSPVGSANVTGAYTAMTTPLTGADAYQEIAFTAGAGSIAPGSAIELQCRFWKNDWSTIDNSLNYSYNPALSYADWSKVVVMVSGAIVWGTAPGGVVSSAASSISSTSSSKAALSSSSSSSSRITSSSSSKPVSSIASSMNSSVSSVLSSVNSVSSYSGTSSAQSGTLKVQFYNGNATAVTGNQIYPKFRLVNAGTSAVLLNSVKIRYYYTADGTQAQTFSCDWSPAGSVNVSGAFIKTAVKPLSDNYLEVSFSAAAGSLGTGQSLEIQGRVWKSDWSNFDQANDYSFNPVASSYQDSLKTPLYQDGKLVWGLEP